MQAPYKAYIAKSTFTQPLDFDFERVEKNLNAFRRAFGRAAAHS